MTKSRGAILAGVFFALALLAWPAVAQAHVIERVSVATDGTQANKDSSGSSLSANARYVAFASSADNLVAGDTNGCGDVFVHDRETGVTERVSVASDGTQGNAWSGCGRASISADGRYVAFWSFADNLVAGDTNDCQDVFVHDRETGITERVSVTTAGTQANKYSHGPSLSADARYVAFASSADNLVAGDTNGRDDVFVRDLQTGTTSLVSVATDGSQANSGSGAPSISADGRHVVFYSGADNLVPGDTNGIYDVFARDLQAGTTTLVSVATDGTQANRGSQDPSISADGRFVAFGSAAYNLVPGDTNGGTGAMNVFVRDRETGVTERVSVAADGTKANKYSYGPSLSADGRYVAFWSGADNIVSGDTNGVTDVFVRDRQTGTTQRVGVAFDGAEPNDGLVFLGISADGRYVVCASSAYNLVPGDTNDEDDSFVARVEFAGDPAIGRIDPMSGSHAGSTVVTISGVNFSEVAEVTFDGIPATSYSVDSDTQITALSPPHEIGMVQVKVTTAAGVESANDPPDDYSYVAPPPAITGLDVTSGPIAGGTAVVIAGTDFMGLTGPGAITFGGTPATSYMLDSPTQITAIAPPHYAAGMVQVRVSADMGVTDDTPADDYTYLGGPSEDGPHVTGVSPSAGPTEGGNTVIVTGTDFTARDGATAVAFGGVNASSWTVDSPTQITAVVPYRYPPPGTVQVQVLNGTAASVDTPADDYTYARPFMERVSVASDGTQANGESPCSSISGNGRYVAFESDASNLVPGDTNGFRDVFVHDRETGVTERVSVDSAGGEANWHARNSSISADGRYVAFASAADNLVPGDTNGLVDVFVHDRETGITERVSVDGSGTQGNGESDAPAMSGGGRYVAFASAADNLVPGDANGCSDVFVHDRETGTTELVSLNSSGSQLSGGSSFPSISADGRYVAFSSAAADAVPGDTNGGTDVFARDRETGITDWVSYLGDDFQWDSAGGPSVSADGRFVAFVVEDSGRYARGPHHFADHIWVFARQTGTASRVWGAGTQMYAYDSDPSISGDGRYVAFRSLDPYEDVEVTVVIDWQARTAWGITGTAQRHKYDGRSYSTMYPCLSADGQYVAFFSGVSDLVPGDTNGKGDIFVVPNKPPTITGLDVTNGPIAGGSTVVITGTGFEGLSGPAAVTFGGTNATSYTVDSPTQITAIAPPHYAAGAVQLRVISGGGMTVDAQADDYTYVGGPSEDGPHVTGVSPSGGPTRDGSTVVVITGTDFTAQEGATSVAFGGLNAGSWTVDSATQITAVAPAYYSDCTVQVQVMNGTAASVDTADDDFIYVDVPWNVEVGPERGPCHGGTRVTITGAHFAGVTGVTFGDVPATSYTVDSPRQITAIAPPHTADGVLVSVTNVAGTRRSNNIFAYSDYVEYFDLRGADRYGTAIKISQAMFPGALPAGSGLVLAPGETFQEALCGGPLAAAYGGPVLLTPKTGLNNAVRAEILRLRPEQVICIGLSDSVRNSVQLALSSINSGRTASVIRGNGGGVYDMSYKVALALKAKLGDTSGATAIITRGDKFPDAIGVSSLACAKKWPILLTGGSNSLTMSAILAMRDLGINRALKVGTYASLPAWVTGVANLSGGDRYATNRNVAEWGRVHAGLSFVHLGLTTGDKFPDALAAGPFMAKDNGILLLSPLNGPLPPVICEALEANAGSVDYVTFIACIEPVVGQVRALLP